MFGLHPGLASDLVRRVEVVCSRRVITAYTLPGHLSCYTDIAASPQES
jgi:hypothetical protein